MSTTHIVSSGECLSSIAKDYGFDDWHTIYDFGENDAFRQLRPNPNLIFPGDEIKIPDKDSGSADSPADQGHKFQLSLDTTRLRIVVQDVQDQPIAGKTWKLMTDDVEMLKGTTGGDGMIDQEIPPALQELRLLVFLNGDSNPPLIWDLLVGHLDPLETISGDQARFNNLAFESGAVDNIVGPITQGATRRFQTKYNLTVDGIIGPETRGKLKSVYGC